MKTFFLVSTVLFANACHGPKLNDTEMPKSKIKANTDTDLKIARMAQHKPNMVPTCKPNMVKVGTK